VDVRDFAFVGGKGEQSAPAQQPVPEGGGAWDGADQDIPFAAQERGWVA
jgi:hypothetical protein